MTRQRFYTTCRNGHLRNSRNQRTDGGCLDCQREAHRRWKARTGTPQIVVREPAEKPIPPTAAEAIAIYRRERELAQQRNAPRMAQLKAELDRSWQRTLEEQKAAQKGGRPRKIINLPPRDRDLRPRAG